MPRKLANHCILFTGPENSTMSEGNMRDEGTRRETFWDWPHAFISGDRLAQSGFHYLGKTTRSWNTYCDLRSVH